MGLAASVLLYILSSSYPCIVQSLALKRLDLVYRWPLQRKVVKRRKGDLPSTRWSHGNIQSTFIKGSMACKWFFCFLERCVY